MKKKIMTGEYYEPTTTEKISRTYIELTKLDR